jgi:hypothetical protein
MRNKREKRDKSRCEADGRVNSGATPNKMSAKSAISAISPPLLEACWLRLRAEGADGPLRAGGWGDLGHVSITAPNVRRSSIFVASISMAQRMFATARSTEVRHLGHDWSLFDLLQILMRVWVVSLRFWEDYFLGELGDGQEPGCFFRSLHSCCTAPAIWSAGVAANPSTNP